MTVEQEVVKILQENGWKVTFAESCTGGLLAGRLVNVSGASEVFDGSVVTYSNDSKEKLLGVKHSTLEQFGAVSEQTAREMAAGACSRMFSDAAVSITGIAGPGGGTPQKPVGLVYIGCCIKGKVNVKKCQFDGDRLEVRRQSVEEALCFLKECLVTYTEDIEWK